MGILSIFRKKKKQPEIEKVNLNELKSWLHTNKESLEEQEQTYIKAILERVSTFTNQFKEKIKILSEMDLKDRKAEGKIKLVVKENLANYLHHANRLVDKLCQMDSKSQKEIIETINSTFLEFEKRSSLNFEKATLLIGKEIGDIKEIVRIFFKDMKIILRENEDFINKLGKISSIESKISDFVEAEKIKAEIEKTTKNYKKCIGGLNNQINRIKSEIEKIKKSEKFLCEEEKKINIVRKKQEQDKKFYELKKAVDFKSLTNCYHSFEKEMNIIKEYKEDFRQAFQKNKCENILKLIDKAKQDPCEIQNKIQDIIKKEIEIDDIIVGETGVEQKESEIKRIKSEIESFNLKRDNGEKRYKKLKINEIVALIKEELLKMNIELIE